VVHFQNKTYNGQTYNLDHLDPFILSVVFEDITYNALIEFSCHCFTETFDPAQHDQHAAYTYGNETRAFDLARYDLSLSLPDRFRALGNNNVYHTKKESFFFLRKVNVAGAQLPYLVFFRSFKSKSAAYDVIVEVSSAYTKPNMALYASPVKFSRMIAAQATNKALPLGPPQQIKRA
jgi:hypothetical protein